MNRFRPRSVRAKTTLAATLATAAVLVVASVLILRLVESDLETNAREALSQTLESASHSVSGEGPGGNEGAEQAGAGAGSPEGGEGGGAQSEQSGTGVEGAEAVGGSSGGEGGEAGGGSSGGEAVGGSAGDARQQALTDASISEVQAGVEAASGALWVIVPAVLVVLALAIWWTVGRALRPVRQISAQVREISGSTLSERVPVATSGDEIAELATLMNEMLDRLETASDSQRAFVADASHELRSPLATITAGIEVASLSEDPQKLQQLSRQLAGEAQRMQSLVADLLDLARLDDDRQQPERTQVDLSDMCAEIAGRFGDDPDNEQRSIEVRTSGEAVVRGIETQLDRIVSNLVDNACRHAGQRVRLSVVPGHDKITIEVEDDGPGVPAPDCERIFERFVRLDDSRGRSTGGAGIGLSLVDAMVSRHGGRIAVDDSPELGGARFTVVLPRG